jgi:hypothetical protein
LPPWQRYAATGAAALALLLLGVVLLVRTPKGTVEIALSDPNARVALTVDKNKIDIAELDEPLSLKVGEHGLKVTGKGYETFTKKFTVTKGKNAPLTVTLVSQGAAPNESTPSVVKPMVPAAVLGSASLEHTSPVFCCQFSPDGSPGEPAPRDVRDRVSAQELASKYLSRPHVREFYETIVQHADSSIQRDMLQWEEEGDE